MTFRWWSHNSNRSLCFLSQKHHTLPLLVIMISWSRSTIAVLENIPHPAVPFPCKVCLASHLAELGHEYLCSANRHRQAGDDCEEHGWHPATASGCPSRPHSHIITWSSPASLVGPNRSIWSSFRKQHPHEHYSSLSTCFYTGLPSPGRSLCNTSSEWGPGQLEWKWAGWCQKCLSLKQDNQEPQLPCSI